MTVEELKVEIQERKNRIKDLEERGDEACSEYDLRYGYNADFYLNRCRMIHNQVKYLEEQLHELTKHGEQTKLF